MHICGNLCHIDGSAVRVLRIDAEGYDFVDDPLDALRDIRANGIRADLFTFVAHPGHPAPKYAFHQETDNFACLPITSLDEWMAHRLDFRARNKIRKAAKAGVTVREVPFDDTLVDGIWRIYNESPVRQGKPFRHYRKTIEEVRSMNATFPGRTIFIGAFLDGAMIGFAKMVTDRDRTLAGLMQFLSMISHRDKAPANALLAQCVQSCVEHGIGMLHYARLSYGKKQPDGLAKFKSANGFEQIEVPRYFVPLTAWGSIALRLQLHREWKDRIPPSITERLRRLRGAWYQRKLPNLSNA
jgi:hypothetical protein